MARIKQLLTLGVFMGTAAVPISNYPDIQVAWKTSGTGVNGTNGANAWQSGRPGGPAFQPVNQFQPGGFYWIQTKASTNLTTGWDLPGFVVDPAQLSSGGSTADVPTVILLDGQSNVFGAGKGTDFANGPLNTLVNPLRRYARVFIWNDLSQKWENLEPGVNNRAVTSGGLHIGPEVAIAYEWENDPVNAGKNLYILKYGINGANFRKWLDNVNDSTTEGYGKMRDRFYRPGLAALQTQFGGYNIRAWFWGQGESDGNGSDAGDGTGDYAQKLLTMDNMMVTDGFLQPDTIRIIGAVRNQPPIQVYQKQYVNALPAKRRFIDTQPRTVYEDLVHYTAAAQFHIGRFEVYPRAFARPVPQPQEGTLPEVDDVLNLFKFKPNSLQTTAAQYSWRVAGGSAQPVPANSAVSGGKILLDVGNIAAGVNQVEVFVTEVEGVNPAGVSLYNNAAFTGNATQPIADPGELVRGDSAKAVLSGNWVKTNSDGANESTAWLGQSVGDTWKTSFRGTKINVHGRRNTNYGKARVEIRVTGSTTIVATGIADFGLNNDGWTNILLIEGLPPQAASDSYDILITTLDYQLPETAASSPYVFIDYVSSAA